MGFFDSFLARIGYTKQQMTRGKNDPIGAAARVERWEQPDPSIYENQARLMAQVSYIYAAVSLTAQAAAAQHGGVYRIRGEKKRAVDNHDLERKLLAPNPMQTQLEFLKSHYAFFLLNGNSYWWLNKSSESAAPAEIWTIPPSNIKPILDERLGVKHYEYDPGDGQIIEIPTWAIVHFKDFHPSSIYVGMSRVEPIAKISVTDIKTTEYLSRIYGQNSGRLPGVLSFRSPIDDDTWKEIKRDIKNASASNNYMLLRGVGENGVDLVNAAAAVKEMEIWQGRTMTRDDIYSIFAPGLLNMTSVNATEANSKTGKQTFSEFTLFPLLTGTAQKITQTIMPLYGPNLVYEFDDPRQVDRALELQEIQEYAKYHKINEVRENKYESDPLDDERGELLVSQITPNSGVEQEEPEPQAPPIPSEIVPEAQEQEPEEPEQIDAEEPEIQEGENEMAAELMKWRKFEMKHAGKPHREFECKAIPPALQLRIKSGLKAGRRVDDVFDNAGALIPALILAQAIDRLANEQA